MYSVQKASVWANKTSIMPLLLKLPPQSPVFVTFIIGRALLDQAALLLVSSYSEVITLHLITLCTLGLTIGLGAALPKNCMERRKISLAASLEQTAYSRQPVSSPTLAKEDFSHFLCSSGVASANSFQC